MNLGQAIKLCRTQRNIKQADLASAANISVSYLSLIERGQRDLSYSTLQDLADALNIPISIIVFLASDTHEIEKISPDLAQKLSHLALKLMESSSNESTEVSSFAN